MRGANSYWRVAVTWLETQPAGTRVTTHQVAAGVGFSGDQSVLRTSLRTAMKLGWIKREFMRVDGRQGGNKLAMWFLSDTPPVCKPQSDASPKVRRFRPITEEDTRDPLPRRTCAPEIQPHPGMLFPGVYARTQ